MTAELSVQLTLALVEPQYALAQSSRVDGRGGGCVVEGGGEAASREGLR